MQTCTICKKEKRLNDFVKDRRAKKSRRGLCKICKNKKYKQYKKKYYNASQIVRECEELCREYKTAKLSGLV